MALGDIREQIKAILSGVEGVGRVHDYERWAADWRTLISLFQHMDAEGKKKINGWIITRTKTAERWITNIDYERVHEFLIRGVYGLRDKEESEVVFQSIIENICAAFRIKNTLNNTCETISPEFGSFSDLSGIQVQRVESRLFGEVLCHYCELGLGVQVKQTRA